jgi:hypothetical protein
VELAADGEYLGPLIAERPSASAGGKWLVKPERGPRLVLFHRPEGVMAYTHSHQCWVAVAPVRGVETHQRWDAVRHEDGRAELRLADERAMHPGDVATLVPPGDVTTMAMSSARVPAPTHSSCWVTTCTSSNGKSMTPSRERGARLHPVMKAGRTADLGTVTAFEVALGGIRTLARETGRAYRSCHPGPRSRSRSGSGRGCGLGLGTLLP